MVLAAVYVLWLYQQTMTGPVTEQVSEHIVTDLSLREKAVAAPLLGLLLFFGFYPQPILNVIEPVAEQTMIQTGATDPVPQAVK